MNEGLRQDTHFQRIIDALHGRQRGYSWVAHCPAHDDEHPSLSLSTGRNGKVLVFCHAGCSQEKVIEMLKEMGLWY